MALRYPDQLWGGKPIKPLSWRGAWWQTEGQTILLLLFSPTLSLSTGIGEQSKNMLCASVTASCLMCSVGLILWGWRGLLSVGFKLSWADVQGLTSFSAVIRHPYLAPECFGERGPWKWMKSEQLQSCGHFGVGKVISECWENISGYLRHCEHWDISNSIFIFSRPSVYCGCLWQLITVPVIYGLFIFNFHSLDTSVVALW